MTENMRKFLEAVSGNGELSARVGTLDAEGLIALGRELGVPLTAADFAVPSGEMDDDELEQVTGGTGVVSCACAMGGGGTKDDNDKTCACVMAGAGYAKDGRERCVCGFEGIGNDT